MQPVNAKVIAGTLAARDTRTAAPFGRTGRSLLEIFFGRFLGSSFAMHGGSVSHGLPGGWCPYAFAVDE